MSRQHNLTKWVAIICLGGLSVVGCSGSNNGPEKETKSSHHHSLLSEIQGRGTLNICSTGDYRPFTFIDGKQHWSGIDVDMAKDLAASLGVEPKFVKTSWEDLAEKLSDDCDVGVGGISITTDRNAELYMSDATTEDGKTPVTRCEDKKKYQTIKDINRSSVNVITPKGGTNEEFADEHFPEAEVTKWGDNNTIFDQIQSGKADVMVTDAPEAKWKAHGESDLCAINPGQPLNFSEQGYAVKLGEDELLHYVNKWLHIRQNDGTYAKLEKAWFG